MLISKFDTSNIESEIETFENKHKFKFPEQYRKFLLKYNDGETPDSDFRINRVESDISGFFGLGKANEYYNYSFFEESNRMVNYLEDDMLPIGENVFGDEKC